jgi:hypothetical protein
LSLTHVQPAPASAQAKDTPSPSLRGALKAKGVTLIAASARIKFDCCAFGSARGGSGSGSGSGSGRAPGKMKPCPKLSTRTSLGFARNFFVSSSRYSSVMLLTPRCVALRRTDPTGVEGGAPMARRHPDQTGIGLAR